MKRALPRPAPDYRIDRTRWVSLVALTHAATETNDPADLKALGDRAMAAEAGWQSLAPFPRGLVCRMLTRIAWAYARQTDPALRTKLAPLLITTAGLVDELHAETEVAPAAPPPSPVETPEGVSRLPYADH